MPTDPIQGPSLPPVQLTPVPDPTAQPTTSQLNVSGDPLITDPAILALLNSSETAAVALSPPGTISIQDSFVTVANAQQEARAQQNSEAVSNPLYYKSFSIGLVDFLASVTFLIDNLDQFVSENNTLHDNQTAEYGTGTPISTDIADLNAQITQQADQAVSAMNTATTQFNKGQITQGQYNAAITQYNNTIATLNAQIQSTVVAYNSDSAIYNSFVPANNSTIQFLNDYQKNFKPPPTPYTLQNTLPSFFASDFLLPPLTPGAQINYSHPTIPTLPPIVPTVDKTNIQDTVIQPLVDQVVAAAQALLSANADAIAFISGLQQFGLRTQLPVPPTAQTSDKTSTSSGGSAATSSVSAGDPFKEAKNLSSNLTASVLKGQYGAGAPTGSALVAATGYLHSDIFSRTKKYSIFQALEILGFNVTPSGQTPVTLSQEDVQSGIPNASAQAGITIRDLSFPVVSKSSDITSTQLEGGVATAAALGTVSTASLVNNSTAISNAVLTSLKKTNLTDAQKAALASGIAAANGIPTTLTSLLALSSAIGAPGLLAQFIGNIPGLEGVNLAPSPLELALKNPAENVFIQASISDSLRSSLNLSQIQADTIASDALNSAIASGNIQSAQNLQDALNSSIAATLIANNVTASDAQNASNLAISALNDETRFSAIQNSVIQLDNLKHEVINNLTNKGIQENDAIRIAQRVADQNSDLIKKQVTASDTASRTIANNALQAGITQSLSNAGVTNELATSAGKEVTAQLVAINPATSALASPTPSQIQTPDVLAGELKTLITHKLEPLVGQQQAATVADQYASAIFTSPNSLLNVTKDQVKTYQNTVSNAQDKTLAETFNNYIAPTKDLWMTAQLMTDPGQMIAHSAATGVMYSQPVAIKNTPPVLLV